MPAKFLGYWVGIALICPAPQSPPESIVFVLRLSQIRKIAIYGHWAGKTKCPTVTPLPGIILSILQGGQHSIDQWQMTHFLRFGHTLGTLTISHSLHQHMARNQVCTSGNAVRLASGEIGYKFIRLRNIAIKYPKIAAMLSNPSIHTPKASDWITPATVRLLYV